MAEEKEYAKQRVEECLERLDYQSYGNESLRQIIKQNDALLVKLQYYFVLKKLYQDQPEKMKDKNRIFKYIDKYTHLHMFQDRFKVNFLDDFITYVSSKADKKWLQCDNGFLLTAKFAFQAILRGNDMPPSIYKSSKDRIDVFTYKFEKMGYCSTNFNLDKGDPIITLHLPEYYKLGGNFKDKSFMDALTISFKNLREFLLNRNTLTDSVKGIEMRSVLLSYVDRPEIFGFKKEHTEKKYNHDSVWWSFINEAGKPNYRFLIDLFLNNRVNNEIVTCVANVEGFIDHWQ